MILTEYNRELHIKNEKKISYEEGFQVGFRQGFRESFREGFREGFQEVFQKCVQVGIQRGRQEGIAAVISVCREVKMDEAEIVQTLMQGFSLSEEEARKCLSGAK